MPKINFKEETINAIINNGKSIEDVMFVRTDRAQCTFNEFLILIDNYEYNNGFGREYINLSLVIVGRDWWLERHEYDGSEWWEFKQMPTSIKTTGVFNFIS